MADYLWVPGAVQDSNGNTYERFCGTTLGFSLNPGTVTSKNHLLIFLVNLPTAKVICDYQALLRSC